MISPAPWEIIDLRHQQNGQLKIQSTVDYSHIANVIARTPGAPVNALLIAAAPDLLAACEAMLATWGTDDEETIIRARDLAETAIAKATS